MVLRSQMSVGLVGIGVRPLGTSLRWWGGRSRWKLSRSSIILHILNILHLRILSFYNVSVHTVWFSVCVNGSFLTRLVVVFFG
jgi:hypothetical protein